MDMVECVWVKAIVRTLSTAMPASRKASGSRPMLGCQAFDAPVSINVTSAPSSTAKALTDSLRLPPTRRTCGGRSSPNSLFPARRNRVGGMST